MSLPDDLKDFRAEDDAFLILTGDQCVVLACALAVFAIIFWPYLI